MEKSALSFTTRCSSERTSIGSRQSSIDQDEISERSFSPITEEDCFDRIDPKFCGSILDDEASRSDFESVHGLDIDENSTETASRIGDLPDQLQPETNSISVPDFSAVNEFFEFRLYDVNHMNRIWDEALKVVNRKSARASSDLVLARPVNDELALWEM